MKRSTFILISVLLNLVLLSFVAWQVSALKRTDPPQESPAPQANPAPVEVEAQAVPTAPAPAAKPPFHWSQVESTNFTNYIDNLRAIGCPAPVIRRVISGELDELYTQRRQQMLSPWQSQIWDQAAKAVKSPLKWIDQMKPVEADLRQSAKKLLDEKAQVLQALLGDAPKPDDAQQVVRNANELVDFLPEEKQKLINEIQQKYSQMIRDVLTKPRDKANDNRNEQVAALNRQKLQEMQAVLTPQEYEEYRLRTSSGSSIRYQAAGFDASEDEWRAMARVRLQFDDKQTNEKAADPKAKQAEQDQARKALDEQYRGILGADRYDAFVRAQDRDYQSIYQVVARCELPASAATQAYEIKRAAQNSARALRDNASLTQEQRQAALIAVQQEIQSSLKQTLGDRGYNTYSRYGGEWVNTLGTP